MSKHFFPVTMLILLGCFQFPSRVSAQPAKETLESSVLPVLQAKCFSCHGEKKQRAGLDLRTKSAMLRGGETGTALKAGSLAESLLWTHIEKDQMPPGKDKLSATEKDAIRRWILAGAPANEKSTAELAKTDVQVTDEDRQFWAFQKPTLPSIPVVKAKDRVRNPIDAFVLAALEKKGLVLSPDADRLTLLRRLTFDLIGLPPTPSEIEAFLADVSADAYEKVVDRLLTSPHYGERWGRHWLDVAGYADSEGILDADYVRTAAWRYRDWVIRAFNQDKPYNQFLQEQIAGDELVDYWNVYQSAKELPAAVTEALIATGFLRCASDTSRPDFVSIKNAPGYYFQTLDDTVKIVSSATLGLTVQCAKCHSHKSDPLPQTEYYRLQSIFMSGYRPHQWVPQVQRRLLEATAVQEKEAKAHNDKIDTAVAGLKKQQQELDKVHATKFLEAGLAKLPAAIRDDVKTALSLDPAKRSAVQKQLAEKYQAELKPMGPALQKVLATDAEYKKKSAELAQVIQKEEAQKKTFAEIRAFYDLPGEAKTHLLRRGDYLQPGTEVTPGVFTVFANHQAFKLPERAKDAKSSGRRLAFARWLTDPDHPLTGRVLVNRVWLHHFGVGLVATPDNFGKSGTLPSHPELLDWLATAFTQGHNPSKPLAGRPVGETSVTAWSLKSLHRLIVTSSAYRQTSTLHPEHHANAKRADPDNRLLWRQRLRRLEGEAMRDALLFVAGTLNPQAFGPPVAIGRNGDGEVNTANDANGNRRSIYVQVRRSQPLTFLQLFDQPVIETNCTRRETSTVASQALTLLNSDFMQTQAVAFAARTLKEQPTNPTVHAVFLAFGRRPNETETAIFREFLDRQTQQYAKAKLSAEDSRRRAVVDLCHMLLSSNEFAYVD